MKNQTEIKYYGLTFEQANETFKTWDVANEFMRVVKLWEDKSLSVYGSSISFIESYTPKSLEKEGQEITREQFDEFYKKTVGKINEASNV